MDENIYQKSCSNIYVQSMQKLARLDLLISIGNQYLESETTKYQMHCTCTITVKEKGKVKTTRVYF